MPHLISYVKNRISYDSSGGRELYTVSEVGRLSSISSGLGLLYFWIHIGENPVLSSQFVLLKSAPAMYKRTSEDQDSICFEHPNESPCSGFIATTGEGYILAPAVKLARTFGSDIVLMFLSPGATAPEIMIGKTILNALGQEATVTLSTGNGEFRCAGTISGSFKMARIVLNRNPGLPVYKDGFNEILRELKEPGSINCVWKPVSRSFEEQVLAFNPDVASSFEFGPSTDCEIPSDLLRNLGADEDTDYVIGDGEDVDYKIRLIIDRGLGRHSSDETKLTVK